MSEFNWHIGTLPKGWRLDDTAKVINGDYRSGPTAAIGIDYWKNLFAARDEADIAEMPRWNCDENGYTPPRVLMWLRWFASLPKPGEE